MAQIAGNVSQYGFTNVLISPMAVWHAGSVWVAYSGPNEDPYMVQCDEAGGVLAGPVRIGVSPLPIGDRHGKPSFYFDEQDRIVILWGCHWTPMKRARSQQPLSIAAWDQLGDWPNATYPACGFRDFQFVTYRDDEGDLYSRRWTGNYWATDRWVDSETQDRGFYWNIGWGVNSIHVIAVWLDETGERGVLDPFIGRRHDLHYMQTPQSGGGWFDAAGNPAPDKLKLSNRSSLRVINSGSDCIANAFIAVDENERPHICYTRGQGVTFDVRYRHLADGVWIDELITRTDHPHDKACVLVQPSVLVAIVVAGGQASGEGWNSNEDRGGSIERWERPRSGGEWTKTADLFTASGDTNYYAPTPVHGRQDMFVVASGLRDSVWQGNQTWASGELHLIQTGSPPPPPPPPAWSLSNADTPWGDPNFRIRDGLVEEKN